MALSRGWQKEKIFDVMQIESLLLPITVVLRAAGIPRKEAERVFSSMYANRARTVALRKIEHIRHSGHFEKISSELDERQSFRRQHRPRQTVGDAWSQWLLRTREKRQSKASGRT